MTTLDGMAACRMPVILTTAGVTVLVRKENKQTILSFILRNINGSRRTKDIHLCP
jgi:hypothetical protein